MLDNTKIIQKVNQIIQNDNCEIIKWNKSSLVFEEMGLGSFDLIMILSEIEEEFNV